MRHRKKGRTLDRAKGPREALRRGLLRSLVLHRSIKTTSARAVTVAPLAERLLHRAKDSSLATRRYLLSETGSDAVVRELFNLAKNLSGNPVEMLRLGRRVGDGAETVLVRIKTPNDHDTSKK